MSSEDAQEIKMVQKIDNERVMDKQVISGQRRKKKISSFQSCLQVLLSPACHQYWLRRAFPADDPRHQTIYNDIAWGRPNASIIRRLVRTRVEHVNIHDDASFNSKNIKHNMHDVWSRDMKNGKRALLYLYNRNCTLYFEWHGCVIHYEKKMSE